MVQLSHPSMTPGKPTALTIRTFVNKVMSMLFNIDPVACISFLELLQFSSVQLLSRVRLFATPWLQHTRPPWPSPTPRACSNPCPSNQWCHTTISSSVSPFSCLYSFPASGSFPMSQFFTSGGQSIRALASASVLTMYILGWFPLGFPLGLTGLISLLSKGFLRVSPAPQFKSIKFWCSAFFMF